MSRDGSPAGSRWPGRIPAGLPWLDRIPRGLSWLDRIPRGLPPVLALVLILLLPWLGIGPFWMLQIELIAFLALIVSGLNLSFGYGGELALGQVASYAAGAYVAGVLSSHGIGELSVTLLAGMGAAALVGFISGVPGLRLGGWALAMVSFFLVLLIPDLISAFTSVTGGQAGLTGIARPTVFGIGTSGTVAFYVTTIVIAGAWFAVMRNLILSRYGTALKVLRESPVLASSLGISVYRLKLMAYVLGGLPAGLAGVLFSYLDGYIAPADFTFTVAISILAASILGGKDTIYGPLLGAAILQLGPLRAASFQQYSLLAYGAFLVLGGLFLSGGILGAWRRLRARSRRRTDATPRAATAASQESLGELPGAELRCEEVSMAFGGNVALRQVTVTARPGRVTALIGPNGSGKTTLLNLISGYYRSAAGRIWAGEREITGARPHEISRMGVARSFQSPIIPSGLTIREVVTSALFQQRSAGMAAAVLRLPGFRRAKAADGEAAMSALNQVGLGSLADLPADTQPLGTRRLIEIARVIASRPGVVLCDEPASGLSADEVTGLSGLLRRLAEAGATVLVVELYVQFVMGVADEVVVLQEGAVIARGDPASVRADPAVIASYLGGPIPEVGVAEGASEGDR